MTPITALALALSYLMGSVPTGLWLGLALRKVDIRQHGSHNIGATNTLRVLGKALGAAALAGDIGKGVIAALLLSRISPWAYAPIACGIAAIIGHTFSLFVGFKGGKGVATSAGVFLALCPLPTLVAGAAFAAVFALTRMVSAGSILAAVALMVAVVLIPHQWATAPTHLFPEGRALRIITIVIASLVIVKHHSNVRRILRKEENRL